MDDDRRDLIARLCTAAGMLMEDVSASAIMIARQDDAAVRDTVRRLVSASDDIRAIVGAAAILVELTLA